jgi:hypothetical protein
MLEQRLGVALAAELLEETGRSLDVREEESDRAGGELGPQAAIVTPRTNRRKGAA